MPDSDLILYENPDGSIRIEVRLEDETVWLTQEQMASLFEKGRSTIAEHILNAYEEGNMNNWQPVGNSDKFETKQ